MMKRYLTVASAPFAIILILAALIPLAHSTALLGPFTVPKAILLWAGAALVFLAASVKAAAEKKVSLPRGPAAVLLLIFLALIVLSTVLSIDPNAGVFGHRGRYFGLITYFCAAALFYVTWIEFDGQRTSLLARYISAAVIPVSVLAAAQRLGLEYPIDFSSQMTARVGSTIGNPNFLGVFLAMSLPLIICAARFDDLKEVRAAALLSTVLAVVGLLSTNSLGAWLAAAVVLILSFADKLDAVRNRVFRGLVYFSTAAPVAGAFAYLWLRTDLRSSVVDRLTVWTDACRAIAKTPILGTGLSTMRYTMPNIQSLSLGPRVFDDAHNIFLTIGASAGLPALIAFLALFAIILTAPPMNAGDKTILRAVRLSLIAYLIGHCFNPESIAPFTFFWIYAGCAAALTVKTREIDSGTLFPGLAALVSVCLLAGTAILGAGAWQAERFIKLADNEDDPAAAWSYAAKAQAYWPYDPFYGIYLFDRSSGLILDYPAIAADISFSTDKAILYSPLDADAYYVRGVLNKTLSSRDGDDRYSAMALSDFQESFRRNRLKLPTNLELAKSYIESGRYSKARFHLRLLLKLIDSDDEHRPEIVSLLNAIEDK